MSCVSLSLSSGHTGWHSVLQGRTCCDCLLTTRETEAQGKEVRVPGWARGGGEAGSPSCPVPGLLFPQMLPYPALFAREKGSPRQAWGRGLLRTPQPPFHSQETGPLRSRWVGLLAQVASAPSFLEDPTWPCIPATPAPWRASRAELIPDPQLITRFQAYSSSLPSTEPPVYLKPLSE